MRRVAWWGVVSSALAPVFLIGGATLAAARQPTGFSSVRDTISALAGLGATDRWLMTGALVALGLCHLVTALSLRPAAGPGRVVLAIGGVAVLAVAAFPLPVHGSSSRHQMVAGISFVALALWPALAWRRGPGVPWSLRPVLSIVVAIVLLALVGWFAVGLSDARAGLSERIAADAQSLWPLIAVLGARSGDRPPAARPAP
jgi:hypothetical membrane protein